MFKVFVLLLSLATGQPVIAESTKGFDTREACQVYEKEFVALVEKDIKQRGLEDEFAVAASKCGTEDELDSQKADK